MDDLSADVDQLIRETDEAFRAVGTALADAKAATQGWYDTPEPPTIITRTPTIPRGVLKKSFRTSVPAVKSPLSRSVSVSKNMNKRTKMSSFSKKRKTNILSWALKSVPPPLSNTPSRWALTDVTTNMVDVFSGKIFRTEVDEMLTPSRMLRLKQELRIENERRASIESFKSEATDGSTPTEPFHLEGLVSRIEMLGKKSPYPIPVLAPPALPKPKGSVPFEDKPETAMQIDDLQFPSPPQQLSASRQQQRNRSNSRVPQLPTIPEVSPLSISLNPIQKSLLPSNSKSKRKPKSSLSPPTPTHFHPQNFIDLSSTPFTLTSPLFRHGPIRLDRECFYALNRARKSDSSLTNEDEGEGEEETFDWTAFQMAILGTMDDEFDEDEDEVEWDEKVREDLFTFWSDLRFNNEDLGRMTKKKDLNLDNEVTKIDIGLDDPRINLTHENLRSDNWRFNDQGQDYETMMQGLRISEQVVEAPVQYRYSMPPSPLVDLGVLRVRGMRNGDVDVVIPMGFNLGHDLGGFLN
ncbi:hypothetical protein B0J14DRAFT_552286 [Halenospora varia]|nr:hypothetical protein B0J14DRAFT_552286 [Halenospora varia]